MLLVNVGRFSTILPLTNGNLVGCGGLAWGGSLAKGGVGVARDANSKAWRVTIQTKFLPTHRAKETDVTGGDTPLDAEGS
jgi:hypothetical protein